MARKKGGYTMRQADWTKIGIIFLALLLFFIPRSVPAAADLPGKFGGIFRVAAEEEVAVWDIHRSTAVAVRQVVLHFLETLFTEDKDFKPIPVLVDTYTTNPEQTVYTFNLRKGIIFHNGKELSTEDVVASLNRWGKYGPIGTMVYKFVKSVEAVDRYTFRINLHRPCGMLLPGLATNRQGAFIFPKEVIEKAGKDYIKPTAEELIGTGPYKFVEFKADRYARLVRFDKYKPRTEPPSGYGGRRTAYFDEIHYYPVRDATVRLAGIETGEFDFAMGISLRDYERLLKNPDIVPIMGPPWYPAIIFNMKKGPLAQYPKLRQAMLMALDIETIMKAAVGNPKFYRLDPSVMWKETAWWTDVGKPYFNQKNVEKAKQLLQESGYKGETIRWISTRDYPVLFDSSFASVAQLRKLGINIDHRTVDWGTLDKIRRNPDEWEVNLIMTSYRTEPALIVYHAPDWYNNWADPEKDALRDQFVAEPNHEKRYELWKKIEKIFYEKVPWIRLGDYFTLDASRRYVKGYTPTPERFFCNTWLEK
jgi:peptide/nickel transport system substrate-binding protein